MQFINQTGNLLRQAAFFTFLIIGSTVFFLAPGEIKSLPVFISAILGLVALAAVIWTARSNIAFSASIWEKKLKPIDTKVLWGIILLGIIMRLAWTAVYPPVQISNFQKYWKLAIHFAETSQYYEIFQGYKLYAYRPPGYPVILGMVMKIFGPHAWIPAVTNTIFYILTSLIVFQLAKKIGGSVSAIVAAAILAVWPTYFSFVQLSATEYIFMLILIGIVWAFDKADESGWMYAALAGLLTGVGTLIRANLVVIPFFWFLYSLMNRDRFGNGIQNTVIGTIFMLAVILPWSMRNQAVFGQFVLVSTNGGSNFYRANNPLASGTFMKRGEKDLDQYLHDELLWNKTGYDWGKEWVSQNPGDFLALSMNKLRIFMGQDNTGFKWSMKAHGEKKGLLYELLSAFSTLWWMGIWFLALVATLRWRRYFTGNALGALLIYSILFLVVIHCVFESQPRYHMPIMAALAVITSLLFSTRKASEQISS